MTIVPAFLPLLAFAFGVLVLANLHLEWEWDRSVLRGAIAFAVFSVIGAEVLGLFHAITQTGLSLLWLLAIAGMAGWLVVRPRRAGLRRMRLPRMGPAEWVMAVILFLFLATTAVTAWLAPPNTWDSLSYHMARVAHWAQTGSLAHFATGIERQNLMPPGAEIGMLHAYVLGQGDRLTNFPQWLAMVGSVVAAAAVARLLGSKRAGQLVAAVFVATLPMGIAQASSTMTDYVEAFWAACVAYESVALLVERDRRRPDILALAAAAGLAILAKPTSFAYLAPFGLLVAIVIGRRYGLGQLLVSTGVVLLLVVALNAGYLGRNVATYGNPLGSRGKLENHAG